MSLQRNLYLVTIAVSTSILSGCDVQPDDTHPVSESSRPGVDGSPPVSPPRPPKVVMDNLKVEDALQRVAGKEIPWSNLHYDSDHVEFEVTADADTAQSLLLPLAEQIKANLTSGSIRVAGPDKEDREIGGDWYILIYSHGKETGEIRIHRSHRNSETSVIAVVEAIPMPNKAMDAEPPNPGLPK